MGKMKTIQDDEREAKQRQINYYVMRHMWQVIRGRGSGSIYSFTGFSRQRYTRALDGLYLRISDEDQQYIKKYTDLDIKIFTGEKRFEINDASFSYYANVYAEVRKQHFDEKLGKKDNEDSEEEEEETKEAKNKDKEPYTANYTIGQWKTNVSRLNLILEKAWDGIEKEIVNKTKKQEPNQFYVLCYNIYWLEHIVTLNPGDVISNAITELYGLTNAENLEKCDMKALGKMCDLVQDIYNDMKAVYYYRTLKNKKSEKK